MTGHDWFADGCGSSLGCRASQASRDVMFRGFQARLTRGGGCCRLCTAICRHVLHERPNSFS